VAERRREIGVRIALGARQGRVVADVMQQGLTLTTLGLLVGVAGSLALSRVLALLLFGVQPSDPTTLATVVGTIATVAAAACLLPAWRASRVDPIVVLREE
jgi:putative ABC transport system permease protein